MAILFHVLQTLLDLLLKDLLIRIHEHLLPFEDINVPNTLVANFFLCSSVHWESMRWLASSSLVPPQFATKSQYVKLFLFIKRFTAVSLGTVTIQIYSLAYESRNVPHLGNRSSWLLAESQPRQTRFPVCIYFSLFLWSNKYCLISSTQKSWITGKAIEFNFCNCSISHWWQEFESIPLSLNTIAPSFLLLIVPSSLTISVPNVSTTCLKPFVLGS